MKHILTHVGVVAVGLGLAAAVGVPMATALPIALVASCAVMMLTNMGGHGDGHRYGERHRSLAQDRPRGPYGPTMGA